MEGDHFLSDGPQLNPGPLNPWAVTSWDSFTFLCCPECTYKSKDESSFHSHAVQNHADSIIFFSTIDYYKYQEFKHEIDDINLNSLKKTKKKPKKKLKSKAIKKVIRIAKDKIQESEENVQEADESSKKIALINPFS